MSQSDSTLSNGKCDHNPSVVVTILMHIIEHSDPKLIYLITLLYSFYAIEIKVYTLYTILYHFL